MSPPVTVAKLQVCVLGVAKGLKAQLDALGASANTSTPEGLHLVLQGEAVVKAKFMSNMYQ